MDEYKIKGKLEQKTRGEPRKEPKPNDKLKPKENFFNFGGLLGLVIFGAIWIYQQDKAGTVEAVDEVRETIIEVIAPEKVAREKYINDCMAKRIAKIDAAREDAVPSSGYAEQWRALQASHSLSQSDKALCVQQYEVWAEDQRLREKYAPTK